MLLNSLTSKIFLLTHFHKLLSAFFRLVSIVVALAFSKTPLASSIALCASSSIFAAFFLPLIRLKTSLATASSLSAILE